MITQCLPGCMGGDWRDAILAFVVLRVAGGVKFRLTPYDLARERYFALFCNGRWIGNYFAPVSGDVEGFVPVSGSDRVSLIAVEVGNASTFGDFVPGALARFIEARNATRFNFGWRPRYALTEVEGDAQLASIVITGAQRGLNVAGVEDMPQRGRLCYSIKAVGTSRIVRWYALDPDQLLVASARLVAEGSRVGNGAVACSAMNDSGLSVACSLTYSADVELGDAFLDVVWPREYQIHYAISGEVPELNEDEAPSLNEDEDPIMVQV